jgi:hypothetical protein
MRSFRSGYIGPAPGPAPGLWANRVCAQRTLQACARRARAILMAPAGPSSHHVGQATTTASTHTSDFVRRRQSAQTSKSAPASKRTGSYHPRSEMDQADCRGGSVGLARSPICSDSSAWWRCATPVTMRLEKHRQHAQERIVQDGAYTTYVCDLAVHPDYQRSGMVANCWHGPDKRGPPQ